MMKIVVHCVYPAVMWCNAWGKNSNGGRESGENFIEIINS